MSRFLTYLLGSFVDRKRKDGKHQQILLSMVIAYLLCDEVLKATLASREK
jgi:hypothetical protein